MAELALPVYGSQAAAAARIVPGWVQALRLQPVPSCEPQNS